MNLLICKFAYYIGLHGLLFIQCECRPASYGLLLFVVKCRNFVFN